MNFFRTSRRDDLISMCYIILFLLNKFEIPGFPQEFYEYEQNSAEDMFNYLKKMKRFKESVPITEMPGKIKSIFEVKPEYSET
jgi:hypothetical protein